MAQRIKQGDRVLVIAGKDKGKSGSVIRVIPERNRVVVEGVNMVTRHIKQRQGVAQAGLVQGEGTISISNVMLIDADTGDVGRVKWTFLEDGTKVRTVNKSARSV